MISEKQYCEKLSNLKNELSECSSKNEVDAIHERILRQLLGIYPEGDPIIKRCKCTWRSSPKALANASNAFGGSYHYVSEHEEEIFWKNEIRKHINCLIATIDHVISIIKLDGFPINNKTAMMIDIKESQNVIISAGNSGNTTQSNIVNINDFNKYYALAKEEIEQSGSLSKEQCEELLDLLSYYKECKENGVDIKRSFAKKLKEYSLLATSIGANMVTLWSFIEPYITPLVK